MAQPAAPARPATAPPARPPAQGGGWSAPQATQPYAPAPPGGMSIPPRGAGKTRSPIGVLLLAFITFGIYTLVWEYKTSKENSTLSQKDIKPGMWILVTLLAVMLGYGLFFGGTLGKMPGLMIGGLVLLGIGFLCSIIFMYKFSENIHNAHLARGVTGLGTIPIFLLLFLVWFVGIPVAQAQMNKLWR